MKDCLFCKIAAGEIPSKKVYEDERIYAFRDINPQAPVHILVIPKAHTVSRASEIDEKNSDIIARIFEAIPKIAQKEDLQKGYRIVTNCGEDARQTVEHIHFHLLGGRKMRAEMA